MYEYWVCAARETPIFSPVFSFQSISFFTNYQKSRSITILLFFWRILPFRRASFFKISLLLTRSSPPAAGSRSAAPRISGRPAPTRRVLAVPKIRMFTAQNGSSSFRSPAFLSSKRLMLIPEPSFFTLGQAGARSGAGAIFYFAAAHIPTKICRVSTPPPPPFNGKH